jgi:hypothetical protein
LIGMVGRRNGLDAFDGKHSGFSAKVAVAHKVQAACGIPQSIGIDFSLHCAHAGS